MPAGQYRRPRRLDDLQTALDLDEPPQDPLGHLERIAPLLPERLQFAHDFVEPPVDMPAQLGDLLRERGSAHGWPSPAPTTGSAAADRLGAAVCVCSGAGEQVGEQL